MQGALTDDTEMPHRGRGWWQADTDVVIDVPEAQIGEITELINGIVTPD